VRAHEADWITVSSARSRDHRQELLCENWLTEYKSGSDDQEAARG
jgi:hypothetical protein